MHLLPPLSFLLLYAFFLSFSLSMCVCVYGGPGEKRDGGDGGKEVLE